MRSETGYISTVVTRKALAGDLHLDVWHIRLRYHLEYHAADRPEYTANNSSAAPRLERFTLVTNTVSCHCPFLSVFQSVVPNG